MSIVGVVILSTYDNGDRSVLIGGVGGRSVEPVLREQHNHRTYMRVSQLITGLRYCSLKSVGFATSHAVKIPPPLPPGRTADLHQLRNVRLSDRSPTDPRNPLAADNFY